jgi:ubiquinone/menaquinone biosynthesis C-methylase UbiE
MSTAREDNLNQKYLEIYTEEARVYDSKRWTDNVGSSAKNLRNRLFFEILKKNNLLNPDTRIIDIASGTGRIALELVTLGIKKVVATDLTAAMLEVSKSKLPEKYRDNLEYHVADMKHLPFQTQSFDAATIGAFFYLVPLNEYSSYVKDVSRVLKKDGMLVCEIMNMMHLLNPIKFIGKFYHRHILGKKIKSHAYPWELANISDHFVIDEIVGTDFPYIFNRISRTLPEKMGRMPIVKYLGGRFVVSYRNK